MKWTIQVHWADRMRVVLHPTDWDATIVLGPSESGLGGQDALDGFPASGRNAYTSGANAFFADDVDSEFVCLEWPILRRAYCSLVGPDRAAAI